MFNTDIKQIIMMQVIIQACEGRWTGWSSYSVTVQNIIIL